MKSQKQRNRSPRPFKSGNGAGHWNGGQGGFIPAPNPTSKPAAKVKKSVEAGEADQVKARAVEAKPAAGSEEQSV